jgi:dTDP-4-amino-4,6-dideoxygalactose transaminase
VPLDFPQVKNCEVNIYEVTLDFPTTQHELKEYLAERGIETGIHYPIALPKLNAYFYIGIPDTTAFYNQTDDMLLSLPIGEHMTLDNAEVVTNSVREFFNLAVKS